MDLNFNLSAIEVIKYTVVLDHIYQIETDKQMTQKICYTHLTGGFHQKIYFLHLIASGQTNLQRI